MSEETMIVKYWGVRGSVPAPITAEQIMAKQLALLEQVIKRENLDRITNSDGKFFKEDAKKFLSELPLSIRGTYGGDTTCIEVQAKDSPLIMIDAGTGARNLGKTLIGRLFSEGENLNSLDVDNRNWYRRKDIHLFFTHYHWDHIQGLPFFNPAFVPGGKKVTMHFYGRKGAQQQLSDVLRGQQTFPNFPVVWEDMPCDKHYHELGRLAPEPIQLGKAKVTYTELTHPDAVFAYAIEVDGKKFVCATDTEHKDRPDPRLVKLAKDAKVLYYDAQYTPEEYEGQPKTLTGQMPKFDWGHSTYEWAVKNAITANVETIVLGHLEPLRDDFNTEKLLERALDYKDNQLKLPENAGKNLNVIMAYQGLEQKL